VREEPAPGAGILVFSLGGRRYGLRAAAVREIHRSVAITRVPGGREGMEGIIDVRGTVLPVFELRTRFGHPARANHPADRLLVVSAGEDAVALRVDAVLGMEPAGRRAPRAADAGGEPLPSGSTLLEDGLVLIDDVRALLPRPGATAA